jgi:PAS domain S-box-containing protein
MDGATTLISIARILTTEPDLTEALRQVAREVARFVGAETAAVYLLDRDGGMLVPVAAYRVPKHTLSVLASARLRVDEQGFRDSVFSKAAVTCSSDVPNDPQFTYELFHRFPHRSGVIVPVHVEGVVAGAFYLVWRERAQRLEPEQIATLEAVGQQVALLLRSAWLLREAERQRAEALAAEERYRSLVDNVPVGIYRNSAAGRIIDVNPALLETLRFPNREALLATKAATLYVDPRDRERLQRPLESAGRVQDFALQMRTGDGGTVWVRLNSRSIRDADVDYYEGTGALRPGPGRGPADRRDRRPHGQDHAARNPAQHGVRTDARPTPLGSAARPRLVTERCAPPPARPLSSSPRSSTVKGWVPPPLS